MTRNQASGAPSESAELRARMTEQEGGRATHGALVRLLVAMRDHSHPPCDATGGSERPPGALARRDPRYAALRSLSRPASTPSSRCRLPRGRRRSRPAASSTGTASSGTPRRRSGCTGACPRRSHPAEQLGEAAHAVSSHDADVAPRGPVPDRRPPPGRPAAASTPSTQHAVRVRRVGRDHPRVGPSGHPFRRDRPRRPARRTRRRLKLTGHAVPTTMEPSTKPSISSVYSAQ